MQRSDLSVTSSAGPPTLGRTYVVLAYACDAYACDDYVRDAVRPLGTVVARGRAAARRAATLCYADVAPAALRVQAAGSARTDLLATALALDAVRLSADRSC